MAFREEHELHKRRFGRNLALGGILAAFVVLVFGLTIVKMSNGNSGQAFDHVLRPELTPEAQK